MKNPVEINTENVQFQKDIDHLKKMLEHFEETNENLSNALSREREIRKQLELQSQQLKSYQKIVTLQNRKINRELRFFQNLQDSIQASEQLLLSYFPDSCILQMCKEDISGDAPWIYKKDAHTYIAVIDSSPDDGLSSATVSMITTLLLNTIAKSERTLSPAEILDQLHRMLWNYLKQDHCSQNASTSVDISVIRINTRDQQIMFAGAHSDCILLSFSENNLIRLKGSKYPIGGIHYKTVRKPYEDTIVPFRSGDVIYLATNGLYQQLGGMEGNKFSRKRFMEFLRAKRHLRMQKVASECLEYLDEWMLGSKQTDDILMLGIRF